MSISLVVTLSGILGVQPRLRKVHANKSAVRESRIGCRKRSSMRQIVQLRSLPYIQIEQALLTFVGSSSRIHVVRSRVGKRPRQSQNANRKFARVALSACSMPEE